MANAAHYVPPGVRSPSIRLDRARIEGLAPGEREQALVLLGDLERVLREARIQVYEPAGFKHHEIHMSRARARMFAGGNRSGKTWTGVVDDVIQVTPYELLPQHLHGYREMDCPARIRIVVPNLTRGGAPIKEVLKAFIPQALMKGGSFERAWRTRDEAIWLECGCHMELLSCEQDVIAHGGTARERVHYDEEPTQLHRIENTMRLASVENGHELFTFTPLAGLSWTYKALWKRRDDPGFFARAVGMRDNRFLRDDDVDFVLSVITNQAERRQREFGEFAERGGQVYPNFLTAARPQITREEVSGARVLCSIDPGWRNAGFVWAVVDRDGLIFVFAAALLQHADVDQYAELCHRVAEAWGIEHRRIEYICDPAYRQSNQVTGKTIQTALIERGIYAEAGQNALEDGILEVRGRLNAGTLRYCEELTGLEDEAIEYAAKPDNPDGTEPRFDVIRRNNHRLDALRYLCMHVPYDPRIRAEQIQAFDAAYAPQPKRAEASVMGALS